MNIQEHFFLLAGRIDNILNAAYTMDPGISSIKFQKAILLNPRHFWKSQELSYPRYLLLTFDGKFENWLLFKNMFYNMIDSRTDLSDIDKMHYLKSALVGEAANKIKIFEVDGINYSKT